MEESYPLGRSSSSYIRMIPNPRDTAERNPSPTIVGGRNDVSIYKPHLCISSSARMTVSFPPVSRPVYLYTIPICTHKFLGVVKEKSTAIKSSLQSEL